MSPHQNGADIKVEIARFRADIKSELARFGADLKVELARFKANLIKWIIGIQVTVAAVQTTVTVGLLSWLLQG